MKTNQKPIDQALTTVLIQPEDHNTFLLFQFLLQNTGSSELKLKVLDLGHHHQTSDPDLEGSLKVTPLTLAPISKSTTVLSRTPDVLHR